MIQDNRIGRLPPNAILCDSSVHINLVTLECSEFWTIFGSFTFTSFLYFTIILIFYKFLLTSLLIVLGISDFLYSTFSFTSFTSLHRSIFICLFSHLLLYFSNTASTSSCTFLILFTNSIVFSFFQYLLSSATLFYNSL